MAALGFSGMGCKTYEAANGRSPSQRAQRRRPPGKPEPMRVATKRSAAEFRGTAKSRARGVALLGIVVRATTFVVLRAIIPFLSATRLMEDLISGSYGRTGFCAVPGSSESPVFGRGAGSALRAWQTERVAVGVQKTIHRTHNNTLRLVKVAHALIAFVGVDNKNIITFRYCPGRAHRHTKTAIDAIIGNR